MTHSIYAGLAPSMLSLKHGGGSPSGLDTALVISGELSHHMSSCLSMMLADWIERAVEMDGVSYLKTPEEELSWIVLYNMDVYSALIFSGGRLCFSEHSCDSPSIESLHITADLVGCD